MAPQSTCQVLPPAAALVLLLLKFSWPALLAEDSGTGIFPLLADDCGARILLLLAACGI